MNINVVTDVLNQIQDTPTLSKQMHEIINGLDAVSYASVATVFIIGREGWDNSQCDEAAQRDFIEHQEANGVKVTGKMLEDKFLTSAIKQKQLSEHFHDELRNAQNRTGDSYNHNWLSLKTNIKSALQNGITLIQNI